MDDLFFRIFLGLIVVMGIAGGLFIFLYDPPPRRYVGLPAGGSCGYSRSDGTRTCVAGEVIYTCVPSGGRNYACAPAPRTP